MRYLTARNRIILREMVVADFKVRYQGSVLGYLWSLLKPLFMFLILYVVFTYVFSLGNDIEHYPVYLLLGVVFWSFFSEATTIGAGSVVSHGDLIRKVSIPRYLVVVSSSFSALINLFLNLLVVLGFALISGITPNVGWLLLPIIILELYLFAQAISFFLAAATVRFRDVTYIWELVLQAGFYVTPILYALSRVPEQFQGIMLLNPMAQIMQDARQIMVTSMTTTNWELNAWPVAAVPVAIVVLVLVLASMYFKKRSATFAEDV
jgi:ABC-2 type transport system permease protein